MKKAKEALRMMPLAFLKKCLKHYSQEDNQHGGTISKCLFCQKYRSKTRSVEIDCVKCPFAIVFKEYEGCAKLKYSAHADFGRYGGDYNNKTDWWKKFNKDLSEVIQELS